MKRIICVLLCVLTLAFCMVACQKAQPAQDTAQSATNAVTQDVTESDVIINPGEPGYADDFKVYDRIYNENSKGEMSEVWVRLPQLASCNSGAGQVVENSNDTMILMGAQSLEDGNKFDTIDVDKILDEFFPSMDSSLRMFRRYDYKDFKFSVNTAEPTTINGYSMCKYTGVHNYNYADEPKTTNYVAYTAQLKKNGAFVYWLVFDDSDDHRHTELIDEYATKIAYTLSEEDEED